MFIFYTAHQKNQTDDRCFVQWFGVRIVIGIDDISWRYGNVVGECFLCVCVFHWRVLRDMKIIIVDTIVSFVTIDGIRQAHIILLPKSNWW